MEVKWIEDLLEKYLEGNSTIEDEKVLKKYFESNEVPEHLLNYKDLFVFYSESKKEQSRQSIKFNNSKKSNFKWIGIAASFVLIATLTTLLYLNYNTTQMDNLGTFDNPELAFIETHKALQLVSTNINSGMESVLYLEEYEKTKKTIFK